MMGSAYHSVACNIRQRDSGLLQLSLALPYSTWLFPLAITNVLAQGFQKALELVMLGCAVCSSFMIARNLVGLPLWRAISTTRVLVSAYISATILSRHRTPMSKNTNGDILRTT